MSRQQTAELLGLTIHEYDLALFKAANYAGALAEQERIIKLLEEQEVEGWFDTGFKQHLIALIKGENK